MLHLIHEHAPKIPIVFIDTGYLFPETYRYIEQLSGLLEKLDLRIYQPSVTAARMEALWGKLWEGGQEDMDRYAMFTKIEPMNRALRELGADVWLSGLRRSQSKDPQRPALCRAPEENPQGLSDPRLGRHPGGPLFPPARPAAPSARRAGIPHHGRLAQHQTRHQGRSRTLALQRREIRVRPAPRFRADFQIGFPDLDRLCNFPSLITPLQSDTDVLVP
jgi:hypothetical protein